MVTMPSGGVVVGRAMRRIVSMSIGVMIMNRAHTPKVGVHVHAARGNTFTRADRTKLEAAGVRRLCSHCDSTVDVYVNVGGTPEIIVRHRADCPHPRRRLSSSNEGYCSRS